MTENEAYRYDEGYTDAMNFIRKQIQIIDKLYPGQPGLIMVELSINQAQHSRNDVDKFASKFIEKLDELKK